MRLAYVDPHVVPDDSPESLQILYTTDALAEVGIDTALITPKPRRARAPAEILGRAPAARLQLQHVPDLRKRWWFPLASNKPFYRLATRAVTHLAPDVVLVRNLRMAEHLLRRAPHIPLVFETHEVFAQTYREDHPRPHLRERRKLQELEGREAFVYGRANGLIALTSPLLDDIRSTYRVKTPAIVAPDGVDLRQAQASAHRTGNAVPMLLYLGSLHPWKGVDTLIRAMKQVAHSATLAIIGGSDERIAELTALAKREGVAARVRFEGPVEPAKRFEWIHRADICLLPSTPTSIGSRYTSPLKLFEYMAAGKAIVVSDLASIREVVTSGIDAVVVPPEPRAFAEAIDSLLADPDCRERLGRAAAERACDFSWTRRADIIARFIESAVRSSA